jgi:hypothetical protein
MTISFKNDNDVIVYSLQKIISYARHNQYNFLAQSVWLISSIIGLQQGLIIYIDNLKVRSDNKIFTSRYEKSILAKPSNSSLHIHPSRVTQIQTFDGDYSDSREETISTTKSDIHNEVIEHCEAFLGQSKKESKAIGRKKRQASKSIKRKANKSNPVKNHKTQTEGIDINELRPRKAAGECQRCAWPRDRIGGHKTLECFRWKRLDKGTAPFPKNTRYTKD